jgi:hypothetical protein
MNARLGFSIAAHLEPDVLIIDEVLAVGDMRFQERAFGRIRELARSGLPVVMVSHQLDRVAELCTDVIVLRAGEVAARGEPGEAIAAYVEQTDMSRAAISSDVISFDSIDVETPVVRSGDRVSIRVTGRVTGVIGDHAEPFAIRVRSLRTGSVVYVSGARRLHVSLDALGPFEVELTLQANLPAGNYMLEAGAQDLLTHRDFRRRAVGALPPRHRLRHVPRLRAVERHDAGRRAQSRWELTRHRRATPQRRLDASQRRTASPTAASRTSSRASSRTSSRPTSDSRWRDLRFAAA